jgi:hypothetical protein
MANLPSAQAAKGWIMLSFHDCRAEFSANLDSNDRTCLARVTGNLPEALPLSFRSFIL